MLLTNLAFIAWQYFHAEGDQQEVDIYHGISMVNEGLTLLGELPPEKQPALRETADGDEAAEKTVGNEAVQTSVAGDGKTMTAKAQDLGESPVQTRPPAGEVVCLRIGDIDGRPALDQLLKLLQANGATEIENGEMQVKRTNYWVMLPPYPNRAKADEAAAILSARRVKDFFIVRSGEYQNAVSLGVFSTHDRAKKRYDQIVGLKSRLRRPKIEAIELPAKRYYVSYRMDAAASRATLERRLTEMKYPSTEEINCR